jgi:hypothetical protein
MRDVHGPSDSRPIPIRQGPGRISGADDSAAGRAILDVVDLVVAWMRDNDVTSEDTIRAIAQRAAEVVDQLDAHARRFRGGRP